MLKQGEKSKQEQKKKANVLMARLVLLASLFTVPNSWHCGCWSSYLNDLLFTSSITSSSCAWRHCFCYPILFSASTILPYLLDNSRQPSNTQYLIPTSAGSWKKQESFRKTSALLTMPKPLTVGITTNSGKFWKRWEYQTTWPASW